MLFLLILIVGLMLGSVPLLWRRASLRIARHGLELARENATDIHISVVKEIATNYSLPAPAHMATFRSGAL